MCIAFAGRHGSVVATLLHACVVRFVGRQEATSQECCNSHTLALPLLCLLTPRHYAKRMCDGSGRRHSTEGLCHLRCGVVTLAHACMAGRTLSRVKGVASRVGAAKLNVCGYGDGWQQVASGMCVQQKQTRGSAAPGQNGRDLWRSRKAQAKAARARWLEALRGHRLSVTEVKDKFANWSACLHIVERPPFYIFVGVPGNNFCDL